MAEKLHITQALIQQYLEGKLDDRTMHALEKQALNDPFLADALEGYAQYATDQQPALQDLQVRLEKRVQEPAEKGGMYVLPDKPKQVKPFVRWLAAAAVLVLIVAGSLMLLQPRAPQQVLTQDVEPALQPKDEQQAPAAEETDDSITTADVAAAKRAPAAPAMDSRSSGVAMNKRAETAPLRPQPAPPAPPMSSQAPSVLAERNAPTPAMQKRVKAAEAAALQYKPYDTIFIGRRTQTDTDLLARSRQEGYIAGEPKKYNDHHKENDHYLISGVVIDSKTGARIPGVSVTDKITNRKVLTDTAGVYSMEIKSRKEALQFNFVTEGYEGKNVAVSPFAEKVDVSLSAASSPEIMIRGIASDPGKLNETVAVARGTKAKRMIYGKATPAMGETVYEAYLNSKKNIIAPGAPAADGEVLLSFTVMPDGKLADFKVLRSLGEKADEAAIRIVKEGPEWKPADNKKKARVEVKVPIVIKP